MKRFWLQSSKRELIQAGILLVIGALAYLLFIKRLGLYGDDWYLIFDAHTQGAAFFKHVFYGDRPARAYVLRLAYLLFGDHLVFYHLSAFLFRYIGALALFWILNQVWKAGSFHNFLMSLLFMIYPGFLSQLQPVDYQPQLVSLCLAMVSIAFTIKAIQIRSDRLISLLLFIGSLLTGLFYLALVEYFIGIEFLRLFFVACLVWPEIQKGSRRRWFKVFSHWLPFSIIPVGFLIWRVFIFNNTRQATDVSAQLGAFLASPWEVGLQWLVNLVHGSFTTLISAWILPFYQFVVMISPDLRYTLVVFAVGLAALIVLFVGVRISGLKDRDGQPGSNWEEQALWGGLAAVVAGILPVIITNRTVDFGNSRYTLAGAVGAVMALVALIGLLRSHKLQLVLVGILVFSATATHIGNTLNHVSQADSLKDFWWQVSWRAPSIEAGTTLIAEYSSMNVPEDYVIWGPANLIYYPEKQETVPITIQLPASILTEENILKILGGGAGFPRDRRGNYVREDFTAILVLTQPQAASCVRIIDGALPELSPSDPYEVMLIASRSLVGNVNMAETSPVLPADIFGKEPQHGWCYYYEKAALAAQMKDWASVITLGDEASAEGFQPADLVEWTPFLRAFVATGSIEDLRPYAGIMNSSAFIFNQTCQILQQTALQERPGDQQMKTYIETEFCARP